MRRVHGDDDGQISLLVLGFTCVTVMLILVVSAASSVHLQHKRLVQFTDAAAADAADAIDESIYFRGQLPYSDLWAANRSVPLSDATVQRSVHTFVADSRGLGECTGLRVARPTEAVGTTQARVTLTCTAHPPFTNLLPRRVWSGIPLTATSTAEAPATSE